jgi:hypothetical protein
VAPRAGGVASIGVSHPSDTRFLVLHGLRLKGFAEPDVVAAAVGLDEATVESHLAGLADDELAARRTGSISGWTLTRAGRQVQQELAAKDLADSGTTAAVRGHYERFLEHNGELLAVCTDWQVRGDVINDHTDAGYDQAVLDRLDGVHEAVVPVVADLGDTLVRYRPFAPRLGGAIDRVRSGEHDYVTKPVIDSYHTVWFELHEDLLTSLGIDRSQEAQP